MSALDHEAPIMDLTNLWGMMGGYQPHIMITFIDAFLESGSQRLAELHRAIEQGDRETIRLQAHTLKSNSRNFESLRLAGLCEELEAIGSHGALTMAEKQLTLIEQEYLRLKMALQTVRANLVEDL